MRIPCGILPPESSRHQPQGRTPSALAMLKRLWPTWFVKRELASVEVKTQRFVISTHTLAIATSLEHWLETGAPSATPASGCSKSRCARHRQCRSPRSLVRQIFRAQDFDADTCRLACALPALLTRTPATTRGHSENARLVEKLLGKSLEAYYTHSSCSMATAWAPDLGTDLRFQVATRRTFHRRSASG